MKRFFLVIIGMLILIIGSAERVYAQADELCIGDPYSPKFNCGVTPFCDPGRAGSRFGLYREAYCDLKRDSGDEEDIYEAVAAQLSIGDEDLIGEILSGEVNPADLPNPLNEYPLQTLTDNVIAAYEKEKVIDAMKKNLKQEFETSEVWYDASLFNSSMDLVVDLNLIDTMLFGSQATWNNDVYKFPSEEEELSPPNRHSEDPAVAGDEESPPSPESEATRDSALGEEEEEPPFDPARDCVPSDSPEAEKPSPGRLSPSCGNNRMEVGEECDDGNQESGDGCSNQCFFEQAGSLMCRDPDVVTFRNFVPPPLVSSRAHSLGSGQAPRSGVEGSPPNPSPDAQNTPTCPAGTLPRQVLKQRMPQAQEVPQSPHYPGPFVGGVLKEFPLSNKPVCPPGQSELKISVLDLSPIVDLKALRMKEYNLGNEVLEVTADILDTMADMAKPLGREDDERALREAADKVREESEEPVCIPTEFCADFDDARDFLFGENWRDDEATKKTAQSIELLFCVELKQAMRPESPYALNEGCIDCHIRGMVDTMDKLLQNTIAPLENTQSAFSISNRWGPKFSFDLNTSIKSKTKLSDLARVPSAIKQANERAATLRQEWANQLDPHKGIAHPSSTRQANVDELITEFESFEKTQTEKYLEDLRFYRLNSDTQEHAQFASRIGELLIQWRDSFAAIQDAYVGIAETVEFRNKKQCEF